MKGKPPLQCRLGLGWKNRYYEVGRRQPGFWIPSKRACKRRIKLAPITVSVGSPIELSFSNIAEASLEETVALADRQSKAGFGCECPCLRKCLQEWGMIVRKRFDPSNQDKWRTENSISSIRS